MTIDPRPFVTLSLGAVALAALAAPAAAQTATPPSTQAEIGTPAPADAAAQGSGAETQAEATTVDESQIQDIVVSARRRDETLQQTPIAITAIAPAQLEAKATINIGDLQGSAPNVLITSQNTGAAASNVSIRGLSFADVDKSFESTVGIVIDGVFIGTSSGSFLDFFDIASIEVLRGPQGTLFGRNTIGGVINIRRTRPTGEFGGKFEATYGNFNSFQARAVVNAPIIKDVLAFKGFYFHNQSDGYYRSGITGERRGGANNENFGGAFYFTPSSNYDALLTLEKQVQDYDPTNSSISATGIDLFCMFAPANECDRPTSGKALYTVFGDKGSGTLRAPAVSFEQNLDLDFTKLTSITGYRELKETSLQDIDSLSADLYFVNRFSKFWQFTQELRAAGKLSDTFDYVVGGFYYQHRYSLNQLTRLFGAIDPAAEQLTIGKSQSYAVFGDFNWAFADRFRLSFGGRYTHDKKQNELTLGQGASFGNSTYSGSKFTPKVGVDYRPSDDLMVYASFSRGYRSGGFSGRGLTELSSTTPYGPETVDSYEVGLKTSFFDRKLLFNIAGFYADYKDLQQNTTTPTPGSGTGNETTVTNVGGARLKGIEMDFTAKPVERLTISGSMGLLKNGFRNFLSPAVVPGTNPPVIAVFDYSAVNMIYAPKITASLNAEYAVPLDFGKWTTNLGYRFISRYDQQVSTGPTTTTGGVIVVQSNDPRVKSDRQNLMDASTSVTFDLAGNEARVTGFVRNLLDDRGPNAAFTVAGLWSFSSGREPRSYGVQVGYKF